MISHHGQRKLRGHTLHCDECFTIWLISCYWNTCLWLQVLMYLFFRPVAAFNIFSKWKLSKSQMLRILLSAHCFAKSEPSPKTLFYFSADHCSLVLSKLCLKINTFTNSILCLTILNISACQSQLTRGLSNTTKFYLTRAWVGGCSEMASSFLGVT